MTTAPRQTVLAAEGLVGGYVPEVDILRGCSLTAAAGEGVAEEVEERELRRVGHRRRDSRPAGGGDELRAVGGAVRGAGHARSAAGSDTTSEIAGRHQPSESFARSSARPASSHAPMA